MFIYLLKHKVSGNCRVIDRKEAAAVVRHHLRYQRHNLVSNLQLYRVTKATNTEILIILSS